VLFLSALLLIIGFDILLQGTENTHKAEKPSSVYLVYALNY